MVSSFFQQIQSWVTRPFTTPLDTVQIFLLVGVLIVALLFWSRIVAHLQEAV